MVRGGGLQLEDSLRRLGWDGTGAVATTIAKVNVETGMVNGIRFETRGVGPQITFNGKDLWNDVYHNV